MSPPIAGATALPRYGYALPDGADVDQAIKASERCGTKDKVVLLPPWQFSLAGNNDTATRGDTQGKILEGLAEGTEAYLRLQVRAGDLSAQATEKTLTARVAEFLGHLPLANSKVRGLMVEVEESGAAPDQFSFALVSIAVQAKGTRPDLQLAFAFPGGFIPQHGDLIKRLAFYSDSLGTVFGPDWQADANWIAEGALNKPVVLKLEIGASASPEQAGAEYVNAALAAAGTSVNLIWVDPPGADVLGGVCTANNALTHLITPEFNPVPPAAAPFKVTVAGGASGEPKWFADSHSPDLGVVVRVNGAGVNPKTVTITGPAKQLDIQWYDPVTGNRLKPGDVKTGGQRLTQSCACDSEYALIFIHQLGGTEQRAYSTVNVTAQAELTVEEIIARWQQYRASQKQKLDNYIASCFMTLHFDATSFGPGFDVSMPMKQFSNNRTGLLEWAQTGFYIDGVKLKHEWQFPLPQLEPEKVMTQPLELTLNEKYSYKLLGTEQVNGVYAFVIGIEPREQTETLYSGKVWIDGTTFRHVKMYLTQRGAKGNVVANVETQNYELISDGKGNQFNLLVSIYAQQTLNAADRDFILEKTYKFSDYLINAPDFETQLSTARSSNMPMYRETATGLRVLKKEGDQRVEQDTNTKRVRSIVAGAFYEGTYNFPIPLAGFSFVDFNYHNTGSQLSLFFAGPLLAGNLSHQYGRKFRLGLDLALSGLPGQNRVFCASTTTCPSAGNTEVKTQEFWNWQESAGLRATWQASTALSLTASSYLQYDYYRRTSDTAENFILPQSGVTIMPTLELKYARHGYTLTADADEGWRPNWKAFGFPGAPGNPNANPPVPATPANMQRAISAYTLYSGDFDKNFYFGKFTRGGVDFSYYGGNPLDRISRYWPSLFSRPRIRGVPSGTDSFDAIAVGSAYYGLNIAEAVKFEGSYNYARARNTAESLRFKKFDGVEFDASTAGPWGTYLQATVTCALAGDIPRYNSRWAGFIMIFKPLR
jgi:MFS family permease